MLGGGASESVQGRRAQKYTRAPFGKRSKRVELLHVILRQTHIFAVLASGVLFAARGLGLNVLGWTWVMNAPLRYGSYAIDTVLLLAAISLAVITGQYPFVDGWLTAKILLLVVYILLGSFALKRGRTRTIRIACWCGAMLVFVFIIGVARMRDPLGWFAGWQ